MDGVDITMKIEDITNNSKLRAENISELDGGFLVPVYAVVKTDSEGNVMSITHDHLNDIYKIEI